jgi:hypothetical protein
VLLLDEFEAECLVEGPRPTKVGRSKHHQVESHPSHVPTMPAGSAVDRLCYDGKIRISRTGAMNGTGASGASGREGLLFVALLVALALALSREDRPELPVVVFGAVVIGGVLVVDFVRPGIVREAQYDHPTASTVGIAAAFGGMALVDGRPPLAVMAITGLGALVAVIGRPGLERHVERERE